MRRLSQVLTLCWLCCMAALCARAETLASVLDRLGMTEAQAAAFTLQLQALDEPLEEAVLVDMLSALIPAEGTSPVSEQIGDVYADTRGFSVRIPQGWSVLSPGIGEAVVFEGPPLTDAFAPTIVVLVTPASDQEMFAYTLEEINAAFEKTLRNYRTIDWLDCTVTDDDIPARELVCMYGADETSMVMQYQMLLVKEDAAFLITMTTLAEEAMHEEALEAYDAFLEELIVFTGDSQSNG